LPFAHAADSRLLVVSIREQEGVASMKIRLKGNQCTRCLLGVVVLIMARLLAADCAAADEQATFGSPSGNIDCTYTPAGGTRVYMPEGGGPELSCDRVEPRYVRVVLGPAGPATIIRNVGDASGGGNANVLSYGSNWSRGAFACKLTNAGLSCVRAGKRPHGFFISHSGVKAY
jgi:hypothetical protein